MELYRPCSTSRRPECYDACLRLKALQSKVLSPQSPLAKTLSEVIPKLKCPNLIVILEFS
jgi:hypothetical protein